MNYHPIIHNFDVIYEICKYLDVVDINNILILYDMVPSKIANLMYHKTISKYNIKNFFEIMDKAEKSTFKVTVKCSYKNCKYMPFTLGVHNEHIDKRICYLCKKYYCSKHNRKCYMCRKPICYDFDENKCASFEVIDNNFGQLCKKCYPEYYEKIEKKIY